MAANNFSSMSDADLRKSITDMYIAPKPQSTVILPTTPQAPTSTYASRLRTGVTLLMQPILHTATQSITRSSRRGGVVNYADPGSGDDIPDAGALDSDDSDFVASGGTRTSVRQAKAASRLNSVFSVQNHAGTPSRPATSVDKSELDQSYLGHTPPERFLIARPILPTPHVYPSTDVMSQAAKHRCSLVPIRVEFETDTHRIRDCFMWNLREQLISPEVFAQIFCHDLDVPLVPWADTVANQIRAQLEDNEGVASMDLGVDGAVDVDGAGMKGEELSECRVILEIDVQIANYHLLDHIEWDLLSPLAPETFATKLCAELGLHGEAIPLIAHAVHEELLKHKKDAVEWGVVGGERDVEDRTGAASLKDKTGLHSGWSRTGRDGRAPRALKSVWRDWADAEEFRTRFEILSAEEVERRELERERASRRLRRETSKFQSSTRSRRRF
ncbi:SNF5-domain-containing protein [Fistulina hepatica ATCC 64428]|uniref:SNF5-domain-containing protein n=1 Tax=Fistulina hepatica ATCC 64428 TaxID=1128425 RepID=A0A0D7A6S9_9AGAR|nr:SNF5-domain-containing protein [Fistulina hepatica ATCC 64428]